jgi:ferredoxin
MKVSVDRDLCAGHGRCYDICPDVYGEDEEGYCVIATAEVPEALQAAARRAADNCPELAITIEET